MRTSSLHPLEIACVSAGENFGRIGLTFCPGKCQADSLTGGWQRDLCVDLDAIMNWGAAAVVTLNTSQELASLLVPDLGSSVADRYMTWFHLPIADVSTPDDRFEEEWKGQGEAIRTILRGGFDVLVHCKGGLGRTGMIAARLLVDFGWAPSKAIDAVRGARPGSIETNAQAQHVLAHRPAGEPHRPTDDGAVEDRALGALLGLAVGDALGTTFEFQPRDANPRLTDMIGGGPFHLQPGQWTDDTSMALALGDSLLACRALDTKDLMDRFVAWWRDGRYSCTGHCFDIGNATSMALARYESTGEPISGSTDPYTAGNGSLMRLAPVVLHGFQIGDLGGVDAAGRQSTTTHAAPECIDACRWFAFMLYLTASGRDRSFIFHRTWSTETPAVDRVFNGSWRGKHRHEIRSTGYVVDSLEAAIWSVARTTSFRDAVLLAVNLGGDADTVGAITGQLAGALYGMSAIPQKWLAKLAWRDKIETLGRALLRGEAENAFIWKRQ